MGDYQELYREINGRKYVDAVVISISVPDDMSFESMNLNFARKLH